MRTRPIHATVVIGAILAAACGDGGSAGAGTAAGNAFCRDVLARVDSFMSAAPEPELSDRHGGTAVVGYGTDLSDGMNALVSQQYEGTQHQNFLNLMTLLQYDEDLELVPYLAESWEINEEGTELTFRLRDDVYWHDGHRTDAYDVEFTYLRATDPATAYPNLSEFQFYEQGDPGVEVLDSLTVRFHIQPHVQPLDVWAATAIAPEHLLGDVPPAQLRQHPYGTVCPVGNGPFVFEEHRQNERWTFTANPWFPEGLGGRPYLDRYVYRVIPEPTTLLTDLLTGSIDAYIRVTTEHLQRIENDADLRLETFETTDYTYIGWNQRIPELEDRRVRRALTQGIDRQQIVDAVIAGRGRVLNTSVLPWHWAYDEETRGLLPYDPEAARSLLDEAGWVDRDDDGVRENADGLPLEIVVKYRVGDQIRQDIAEIIQAQLAEVGVAIVPEAVEMTTLISQLTNPQRPFEATIMGWVRSGFKLDDTDLFHSNAASRPYGFVGLQVDEIDQLLDTLQLIPDREEALPYWERYQELIVEHQPYTFLFTRYWPNGINERLRNTDMDIRGEWRNARNWWIPEDERIYAGS